MSEDKVKRLEMHITYSCMNNCLFCSEAHQLKNIRLKQTPFSLIKKNLEKFQKKGIEHVTFTGGEPTTHPDFIKILSLSKDLGLTTYITTNGGRLADKEFADKALNYLDEICFSIHGHNDNLHNKQTRNKDSFSQLLKAVNNCKDVNGFANLVVTKHNFNYLEKIIDFISDFNLIDQILISSIAPEGRGLDHFSNLTASITQFSEKVSSLSQLASEKGVIIRFFGLPLCALDGKTHLSNDLHWASRVTLELEKGRGEMKETYSYNPTRKRAKPKKCKECNYYKVCGGVFNEYLRVFGKEELRLYK